MLIFIKSLLIYLLLCLSNFVHFEFQLFDYSLLFIIAFAASQLGSYNYALLAAALYLISGLAGLKIFAFGGGPVYFMEPGFGFILALVPFLINAFKYRTHSSMESFLNFRQIGAYIFIPLFGFFYLLVLKFMLFQELNIKMYLINYFLFQLPLDIALSVIFILILRLPVLLRKNND